MRSMGCQVGSGQSDCRLPTVFLYNADMNALADFMRHYGIRSGESPRQVLGSVVNAFAGLPYENITKIIRRAESVNTIQARRYPDEVIRDHIRWGTGGTCFSLTSALLYLLRSLGWETQYILADRRYGQDTHCALLVWIEGVPHLLDPGFLIVNPIPMPHGCDHQIDTGFNRIVLAPDGNSENISLCTVRQGIKTYRLTYKTSPVDTGEFFRAWDASFGWKMMRYPLLTRTSSSGQIYVKGTRIQVSGNNALVRQEVGMEDLAARIASEFRIHPSIVARAISILGDGGKFAAT
jgi:arylamine N-acetyltransferase